METLEKREAEPRSIESARDWEDLYNILDEKESLSGAHRERKYIDGKPEFIQEEYSAGELKDRIDKVRKGEILLNAITSGEGLRDKVIEFLVDEVKNWRQLKEILFQIPETGIGKTEKRDATYWLERVEDIERSDLDPSYMTTKYGLRAKVTELLKK